MSNARKRFETPPTGPAHYGAQAERRDSPRKHESSIESKNLDLNKLGSVSETLHDDQGDLVDLPFLSEEEIAEFDRACLRMYVAGALEGPKKKLLK